MKSEEEIREKMEKASELEEKEDIKIQQGKGNQAQKQYLSEVYYILSWVLDEGDDPLEDC